MLPRVVELNAGDARLGRKLYRHFLRVGIPDPQLRLAQDAGVTDDGRALNPVTLEAIADAITGAGLATEAEVAAAIADLAAFAADPQTLLSGPRVFQVWARRP
jgi:hypothetical protein